MLERFGHHDDRRFGQGARRWAAGAGRRRLFALLVATFVSTVAACATAAPRQHADARPAAGRSGPRLAGCPVFPADNAWNRPIASLPVARNSDAIIRSIGADVPIVAGFGAGVYDGSRLGIPLVVVRSGRVRFSHVRFDYARESDREPYPIPANVPIEGAPDHADSGDRHAVILDRTTCKLYELYALRHGRTGWEAGSGAVWDLRSNRLRPAGYTSADAAGLPILPGLVRWRGDASTGRIRHAIRFTVPRTRDTYIFPARHVASSYTDPSLPSMGTRVRLKASVDISKLPRQARIVAQAMKTYGMIVADTGPAWHVTGVPGPHWSDDQLRALNTLHGSDFEVVDTSRLR